MWHSPRSLEDPLQSSIKHSHLKTKKRGGCWKDENPRQTKVVIRVVL